MHHRYRFWPAPVTWLSSVMVGVAILTLAIDVSRVPGVPSITWRVGYGLAFVGYVVWRFTHHRVAAILWCAQLFATSFARSVVFLVWEPYRAAGISLNVLVMFFASETLKRQVRGTYR